MPEKALIFLIMNIARQAERLFYSSEEVFKSNIILKVAPPTMKEIELLKPDQVIVSALQLPTQKKEFFYQITIQKSNSDLL